MRGTKMIPDLSTLRANAPRVKIIQERTSTMYLNHKK